ncbi:uncharacterized protein BJ212DRAFT_810876 [Suillus subaureus]|uniref:Nephrocystin 3-like N-terminal domain-containing protein n=1 Tax=Suillus subaureus TaxID=48587 RepID=A0A9P7EIN9_9AGAM|nr:uncharacterized protein BJ212DRAFT_810876 [Suillus subaureus]KAG1822543.1 hypothetical protein BJ212DRAFT_810876 [Suillus subaureus]
MVTCTKKTKKCSEHCAMLTSMSSASGIESIRNAQSQVRSKFAMTTELDLTVGLGPKLGTPFSTKKLGGIISDMREDAVKIKACASLLHCQESGEDCHANKVARREAEEERIRAEDHRRFQRELDETRKLDTVLDWLSSKSLNDQCFARQEKNLRGRSQITCQWLFSHDEFLQWQNNPPSSPILWVHGPPGSGKSTLCSSAIEFLAKSSESEVVIFHFYDFAQHLSPEKTLSILATQLLFQYRQRLQKIPDELQKIMRTPESLLERFKTSSRH